METINYEKRSDMVAALMAARERGVAVDVVGNGRTLKFPNGIGETPEEYAEAAAEEDALLGVVQPTEAEADGVEKTPVEGDTLEEEPTEDDDLIGDTAPAPKRKRNRN